MVKYTQRSEKAKLKTFSLYKVSSALWFINLPTSSPPLTFFSNFFSAHWVSILAPIFWCTTENFTVFFTSTSTSYCIFSGIKQIWALEKQAKMLSNSVSISPRYSNFKETLWWKQKERGFTKPKFFDTAVSCTQRSQIFFKYLWSKISAKSKPNSKIYVILFIRGHDRFEL